MWKVKGVVRVVVLLVFFILKSKQTDLPLISSRKTKIVFESNTFIIPVFVISAKITQYLCSSHWRPLYIKSEVQIIKKISGGIHKRHYENPNLFINYLALHFTASSASILLNWYNVVWSPEKQPFGEKQCVLLSRFVDFKRVNAIVLPLF